MDFFNLFGGRSELDRLVRELRASSGRLGEIDRAMEPRMGDNPAHEAGLKAVASATDPTVRHEPDASGELARVVGERAVDQEMDRVNTQTFKDKMAAAKNYKRASKAGEAAVAKAVEPTPAEQRAMTQAWVERMRSARAAGQGPVPPTPGPEWGPGEAEMYAKAFGPQFVEQALRAPAGGGPLPMSVPGQAFGPQSVVNPEMESTNPQPADMGSWWRNHIRSLGQGAVEKGLEE